MARMTINLPDRFIFSTDIPIRIGDINHVGHVGNNSYLDIIQEARARFLHSIGFEQNSKTRPIMTDAAIAYIKQCGYGQTLRVDIAAGDITAKGFSLIYRVSDMKTGDEIVRAKTGHVYYDYKQQKVTTIPPDIKEKLMSQESRHI